MPAKRREQLEEPFVGCETTHEGDHGCVSPDPELRAGLGAGAVVSVDATVMGVRYDCARNVPERRHGFVRGGPSGGREGDPTIEPTEPPSAKAPLDARVPLAVRGEVVRGPRRRARSTERSNTSVPATASTIR
jgi:hypothetical protein